MAEYDYKLRRFKVDFVGRRDAVDVAQRYSETVVAPTAMDAVAVLYLKYEHVIWPKVEELVLSNDKDEEDETDEEPCDWNTLRGYDLPSNEEMERSEP